MREATPLRLERREPARNRQRFYAITATSDPAEDDANQAALLRGRPPSLPLARLAATLAALRDLPPASPIRAAVHAADPKRPASRPGNQTSASRVGK